MKRIVSVFAVSIVCLSAGGVVAPAPVAPIDIVEEKAPFYIGLGLGLREIEELDYFIGAFIVGYDFGKHVGIEGRYNIGNDYDSYGGYLKLQYPTEAITPYLLGGYAHSDYRYENINHNFSGFSWGGGVDITTPYKNFKVFGDVMTYEGQADQYDTEHILTVGLKYFF